MIRVMEGDCRSVLPSLPEASVQCCVTSPPYFGLRDYGVDGQIGMEASPDAFVTEMVAVFREVKRVLRDDGVLFLNLGDSYAAQGGAHGGRDDNQRGVGAKRVHDSGGADRTARSPPSGIKPKDLLMIPARVALALQADGWWLRSDIIWAKPNPMPESVTDRPTSAHEHVFLLTKSARYFYDAEAVREEITSDRAPSRKAKGSGAGHLALRPNGTPYDGSGSDRNLRNVWSISTQPFSEAHFATFPPALAERCIKAGTSERGCCSACGAPWVRQTEPGDVISAGGKGARYHDARQDGSYKKGTADDLMTARARVTTGWSPSCECAASVVPCTVLDPFAGAFTSLLVADRLQRHGIGIELNPAYAAMARNRLMKDAGMFADLEALP